MNKKNSEYCDLESKIEIDEDMVFKETNKDPTVDDDDIDGDDLNEEDESRRKEDEKEEEFRNRVTMEEFFPHISGSQDCMF